MGAKNKPQLTVCHSIKHWALFKMAMRELSVCLRATLCPHLFTNVSPGEPRDHRRQQPEVDATCPVLNPVLLQTVNFPKGWCFFFFIYSNLFFYYARCKPVSDSSWNLYGRDSAAGVNCMVHSGLRYDWFNPSLWKSVLLSNQCISTFTSFTGQSTAPYHRLHILWSY